MSAEILQLVATGRATTRAEIAKALGWAPSTVSLRVGQLIDSAILVEGELRESRGGRPGRILRVRDDHSCVVLADVGVSHARVGVAGLTGDVIAVREFPVDATEGPEPTFERIALEWDALAAGRRIAAIGVALAGPVDPQRRCIVQASRMGGWNDVPLGTMLQERFGVPVVVENDADALALGEHHARSEDDFDSVTVKAGTAIGSGLIVEGEIYHGWSAGAGNITHTRVDAPTTAPCSCGNFGCLETVASGAGIRRLLNEQGVAAESTADVVRLAGQGNPEAMTLVRAAGGYLGAVLCTVVNFVNPGAVYLGGALSAVQPFVAAVRSRIYEGSHPIATGRLRIEGAVNGPNAGIAGMARLAVHAAHQSLSGS